MPKRTPLFPEHERLGGQIIDFFGWELPVQYEGILEEHRKTREEAGLFDVSHMGEVIVSGEGAFDYLQALLTNDMSRLLKDRAVYSPMTYENGGTVDDLIVYPYGENRFLVVVNASNADKDFAWMRDHAPSGVLVENRSDEYAQLALQGPKAKSIMEGLNAEAAALPFFGCGTFEILGKSAFVSATGYTGESGFEIYLDPADACELFRALLERGASPVGLGARDTLRLEAGLPLYGNELSKDISPLEAGLARFVKFEKPDYIGKAALQKQADSGDYRRLVGLKMQGRGIPRHGYLVYTDGRECGIVTSGGVMPTVGGNYALALVDAKAADGEIFEVEIRRKREEADKTAVPFYARPKK